MTITPELESAITGLYAAFKGRTLPAMMHGCPCCMNDTELSGLSFTPVTQLGRDQLEPYSWSAIWTVGTESDYRHFTPRLLELMVRDGAFQPEVVAKKLLMAGWRTWPSDEQAAIAQFFDALWSAWLNMDGDWCSVDDVLCVIGNAIDDLSPFLDRWLHAEEPAALRRLAAFAAGGTGFVGQAFWDGRSEQVQQIVRWLKSKETLQVLESRWFADPDGPLAKPLEETLNWLSLVHQNQG